MKRTLTLPPELQGETSGDPVERARKLFAAGYEFWAKPLVEALERIRPRLSFYWASQVMRAALPHRLKSGDPAQRFAWLDEFDTLIERDDVAQYCEDRNRIIWVFEREHHPNQVDRAIAYLYDALRSYLKRNVGSPPLGVRVAAPLTDIAFDAPSETLDPAVLELAIAAFVTAQQIGES